MKAIIVDDEKHCRESLSALMQMHCPEVEIMAICGDGITAIDAIRIHQPDIVFLDIEMPKMNAFDVLQSFENISFEIIFTTAYDQYAIKAIKYSALDYLLKPIDAEEMVQAVERFKNKKQKNNITKDQLAHIVKNFQSGQSGDFKLIISTIEGSYFLAPEEIIYCEGKDNYTHFHLTKGRKLVSAKTLKDYDETLVEQGFLRIHKSYLVNIKFIEKYSRSNSTVILTDYTTLEVSRRKKDTVINALFSK
jgi:two-component system, LytTR family, response regulator